MIRALTSNCLAQRRNFTATSNRFAGSQRDAISSNSGSSLTRLLNIHSPVNRQDRLQPASYRQASRISILTRIVCRLGLDKYGPMARKLFTTCSLVLALNAQGQTTWHDSHVETVIDGLVQPVALAFDGDDLLISDNGNGAILKLTTGGSVSTLYKAGEQRPFDSIAVNQGDVYVSIGASVGRIQNGQIELLAISFAGLLNRGEVFRGPLLLGDWGVNGLLVANPHKGLIQQVIGPDLVTVGSVSEVFAVAMSSGVAYLVQADSIKVMLLDATVKPLAGRGIGGYFDGPSQSALFRSPQGIAVSQNGTIYIADTGNNCIRSLSPDSIVRTVAGRVRGFADGHHDVAQFSSPMGIAVNKAGELYVADTGNGSIRKVTVRARYDPQPLVSGRLFYGIKISTGQLGVPPGTAFRIESANSLDGPWNLRTITTVGGAGLWIDEYPVVGSSFYRAIPLR